PLVAANRRRTAGKLNGCLVVIGDFASGVGRVNGRRNGGKQLLQTPLAFLKSALSILLIRYVARNLRRADNCARTVAHGRYGERYVQKAPVFVPTHSLVMIDAFADHNPGQNTRLLVLAARRKQDRHRAADRLLGGVTEQTFCAGIPGLDYAIQILADDRVVGVLDDRNQLRGGALRGALRFLRLETSDAETELTGERQCYFDLRIAQLLRTVVVRHKLADKLAAEHHWDESNRGNPFPSDRFLESIREVGSGNVL